MSIPTQYTKYFPESSCRTCDNQCWVVFTFLALSNMHPAASYSSVCTKTSANARNRFGIMRCLIIHGQTNPCCDYTQRNQSFQPGGNKGNKFVYIWICEVHRHTNQTFYLRFQTNLCECTNTQRKKKKEATEWSAHLRMNAELFCQFEFYSSSVSVPRRFQRTHSH